jgi:uncharacterized glyoxalase superfamily protein PhnB
VIPRIIVDDVPGLVGFIKHVFGATGELATGAPSELRMGDSMIMVSDGGARDRAAAFLYVYVADTDATHARALRAGAQSIEAPAQMPYGDRRAMVQDTWGNTWQIATHTGVLALAGH